MAIDTAAAPSIEHTDRWTGRSIDFSVAALYLSLALWVIGPLWADPGHLDPAANASDSPFFEWALRHAVRIFTVGEHPFHTPTLDAPYGVNLLANTGLLGLTVPLAPVTWAFGPAVAFTLLLTLGLAATATAWYHVLHRHIVASRVAAAIGGGFAGFAPGLVNHTNGHPNLVAQFLVPFIVWRALTLRTRRDGLLLGLLVTWQAFINEELLFLTGLAGLVFVLGYAVWRPKEVRERVRPFLTGFGVAILTAGVLLAYPLWYQFAGPQSYHGLPEFVLGYGADLASYLAFPKLSLAHGAGTLSPQPEENTFFGWPLVLLLVAIVAWLWRRPVVRALALVLVGFAVLSLGAVASYEGRPLFHPAPWRLFNHLPLFDSVLPIRLGLVLVPVIAVLLALAVDDALGRDRRARVAWLVAVTAALLPLVPARLPVERTPTVPAFFTSGDWRRYVSADRSVLSADTSVWYGGITAMRWDNATGQGYRMVGGYFLGPDATGKGRYGAPDRPTSALLGGVGYYGGVPGIGPAEQDQARADVRFWRAAIVVLAADAPHHDDLQATLDQLFGAGQPVDDVWLWDLRDVLR
jgi:hypothetical protein